MSRKGRENLVKTIVVKICKVRSVEHAYTLTQSYLRTSEVLNKFIKRIIYMREISIQILPGLHCVSQVNKCGCIV